MWQLQGPFHPGTDPELCTPTAQPESLAPSPLLFLLSLPCSVCLFTYLSHLHPRWLFALSLSPFPSKPPLTLLLAVCSWQGPRKGIQFAVFYSLDSPSIWYGHTGMLTAHSTHNQQILSPCLFLSALPPNHAGILPTCSTLLDPASPAGAPVWLLISPDY